MTWTPSGSTLVYACHDSSIHFATFSADSAPVVCSVKLADLPYCSLLAVSEKAVVAVGYDFNPSVFTAASSANWGLLGKLEVKVQAVAAEATGGVAAARALFQNKASRGQEGPDGGKVIWTQHENTVTQIASASPVGSSSVTRFSTSALDGRIVMWDLNKIATSTNLAMKLSTLGI